MTDRSVTVRLMAINSQYDQSMKHSGDVTRDLGTQAELSGAKARQASSDYDRFGNSVDIAGRKAGGAGGGFSLLGAGMLAALPAVPVLTGGLLALGGALSAAGASALSTGLVVKTALSQASKASQELAQAQQAVNNSTNPQARQLALEKQAALIKTLGPDTIALGQATKDLSAQWTNFADSFTPQIERGVSEISVLADVVLPKMQPLVANTFGVFDTILGHMTAAATGAGGTAFFKWLSVEGPRDLLEIANAAGKVGAGLANLGIAFTPVEHQLLTGIGSIAAKFETWSSSLDTNSGFQSFMHEVQQDGPQLVHTIGDVAGALGRITGAFGGLLPLELRFLDDIATLIERHPAAAEALALLYTGYKSLGIVGALLGPTSAFLGLFGASAAGRLSAVALAEGEVAAGEDAIGASAVVAGGKLGGLLKMLGVGSLAEAGPAIATLGVIGAGAVAKQAIDAVSSEADKVGAQQGGGINPAGFFGHVFKLLDTGLTPSTGNVADLGTYLAGGAGSTSGPVLGTGGHRLDSTTAQGNTIHTTGILGGLVKTVTGAVGGVAKAVGNDPQAAYLAQFDAGLNNPANILPYSSTGGSGKTAAQTALDKITAQDDLLHAQAVAAIDPTNKLALAQEAVTDATRRLNNETTKGTTGYYNDLTALHQAQSDLAAEQQSEAQARADAIKQLADAQKNLADDTAAAQKTLASDAKSYSDVLAQEGTATTKFYADLSSAAATHAANDKKLLDQRQADIEGFAAANQVAVVSWGDSLDFLSSNVSDQVDQISKWTNLLAQARGRGVSDAVISALGLDQGPQALGQLEQFSTATQAQIDALNAAVAAKNQAAGQEVTVEAANNYGALGQALLAEQQSYADAVTQLQTQFGTDMANLAAQAATALQQIQTDQAAMAATIATDKAGIAAPGAPPLGTAGSVSVHGVTEHVNTKGIIDTPGPDYGKYPMQVLDSGGFLPPGFSVAFNGTGRNEPVLTTQQLAALTAGQEIVVHSVLTLDGKVIDQRVQKVNAARKTAIAIAGSR